MGNFEPSCIDVEDFLECLDVQNVQKATAEEVRFSCPLPVHVHGDETPSAYMNIESTAWFCHGCHARGSAIHFTSEVLGITQLESVRMLRQRYLPFGIDPDAIDMEAELRKILFAAEVVPKQNEILAESWVDRYAVDWQLVSEQYDKAPPSFQYMLDRGFSANTLDEWEFGYDVESDRILLPVRDEHERLVGFKARATDDRKPKYLNLGGERYGFKPFLKSQIVFGLDRALGEDLIIVEGEFNVIALCQQGYENAVSINGSNPSEKQINLLRSRANKVILFFDSDAAGYDAAKATTKALEKFMPVEIVPDHDGDPADMAEDEIWQCLDQAMTSVELELEFLIG